MIFITQCDSPAFWPTYLPDLASIIMEGILIFNKHSLFLLTVIILLVGWLLFYTIYYFIEYSNKFSGIYKPLEPGLEEVVQATKKKKKLAPKASLGTQKKIDIRTTSVLTFAFGYREGLFQVFPSMIGKPFIIMNWACVPLVGFLLWTGFYICPETFQLYLLSMLEPS